MKKLILTLSVVACVAIIQGCTVTISSSESVAKSLPAGVEGKQGVEGQPGYSGVKTIKKSNLKQRRNEQGAVQLGATGLQGTGSPVSSLAFQEHKGNLDARFWADVFKAVVLGCIQYKC